jgi:hypothetical protein
MKNHNAPQAELGWKEEPFALIQEQGTDFDRLQREREQAEKDRSEQSRNHLDLFAGDQRKADIKAGKVWQVSRGDEVVYECDSKLKCEKFVIQKDGSLRLWKNGRSQFSFGKLLLEW